jgi:hypothetical protein
MQEEQGKKSSDVVSDAAVKEKAVIPATPTDLSDEELDKVAGGASYIQLTPSKQGGNGTLYGDAGNDSRARR